jgi:nucleoside-diphosphate-sugar epimerase
MDLDITKDKVAVSLPSFADIFKGKDLIGYRPAYSVQDGLDEAAWGV